MTEQATTAVEAMDKAPQYANSMEEISALIKGRAPLIWVITHEENRFITDFTKTIGGPGKRETWLWSGYQGLIKADQQALVSRASGDEAETWNPQRALGSIAKMTRPSDMKGLVFIMRDMHTVMAEPIPRQIRDMYDHLISNGKTLIITSPMLAHGPGGTKSGLPPTLEKQLSVVNYELPNKDLITSRVKDVVAHMKKGAKTKARKSQLDYDEETVDGFSRALQGLTMIEVDTSLSTSFTYLRRLDLEKLINDKRQLIRKSQILEFVENPVQMNDVGGLDQAKDYLTKYNKAYTDEAKDFGVEPLKGVLLTGVPGTGKSLFAKAIGKIWGVPLLKLDVGKVMTGLVGGSEGKMREVIDQAEAMAPCILWIDEVEKSLAGTKSSNFSDGGTLARVFGTLLTAMQDGLDGVTIIATANDITMLPPEFIRRFNEVFFVDLPGPDERWEILTIHLEKRGRKIDTFAKHKAALVKASDGYTGAELEKAVKDAIAAAFYAGAKDVGHKDIVKALADTKPLSKVMAKKIDTLRSKAKGTYRFASAWAEQQINKKKKHSISTESGKKVDIDDSVDDLGVFAKTKKERAADASSEQADRFEQLAEEDTTEGEGK